MPQFKVNEPQTSTEAVIKVEVSKANPLPPGPHRFQLVVIDNEGNESEPAFVDLTVQALNAPTAVLELVDGGGKKIDPAVVIEGKSFTLSAAKSIDVAPGKIVQYRFTLLP